VKYKKKVILVKGNEIDRKNNYCIENQNWSFILGTKYTHKWVGRFGTIILLIDILKIIINCY
jgi:hypothetical protein